MKRLAVIPSDAIKDYIEKGLSPEYLRNYFNPSQFFDKVYLLSPLEQDQEELLGMKVIHTGPQEFKEKIKSLGIDLVRAYGGNWACSLACEHKVPGVPVVVSVHDTSPDKIYDSIKKADIVLCMSEAVRNVVKSKYKYTNRIWLLPNRVDFERMRSYPKEQVKDLEEKFSFRYRILHVGRRSKEKNLDTLLKALPLLGKDYGVIAVGQGERKPYQELAGKLNIGPQVFFIDRIAHQEMARYYSLVDCMCTPSRWEGFGIVFIEALACASVVVTSDIAPLNEYIMDGTNGILVKDFEDPRSLADAIKKACTQKDLRQRIQSNARASVECFEKIKIEKQEIGIYNQAFQMGKRGEFEQFFAVKENVKRMVHMFNAEEEQMVKNNFKKKDDLLNAEQWHKTINAGQTPADLAAKIRRNDLPLWCNPLLEHTQPQDALLELGSGTGELSAICALNGRRVHLIDYSIESIDASRELFRQLGLTAQFNCCDILKEIPLASLCCDWVFSSGVLGHFSDEQILHILKESKRIARKGVISLVTNANSVFYGIGKLKMEQEKTWVYGHEEAKFSMRIFFENVGLKNIQEYSVDTYHTLNFWGKEHKEIKQFLDNCTGEQLRLLNQGYLLFTIGTSK